MSDVRSHSPMGPTTGTYRIEPESSIMSVTDHAVEPDESVPLYAWIAPPTRSPR